MDLIIDTETTGLTHLAYASRSNYHLWPRLVQLAWILAEKQVIHCQENVIIRPNGFQIPFKATQVHGITQQRALTRTHAHARMCIPVPAEQMALLARSDQTLVHMGARWHQSGFVEHCVVCLNRSSSRPGWDPINQNFLGMTI